MINSEINSNFLRDEKSKALINNNKDALNSYKKNREIRATAQKEIQMLKNEIINIKKIVSELVAQVAILTKDGEK